MPHIVSYYGHNMLYVAQRAAHMLVAQLVPALHIELMADGIIKGPEITL